jgi:hypothetical protein
MLTDDTITKDDKGLLGLDKKQLSSAVLIPGLKVDVDGTSDGQGRVMNACLIETPRKREETNGGESSSNHDC